MLAETPGVDSSKVRERERRVPFRVSRATETRLSGWRGLRWIRSRVSGRLALVAAGLAIVSVASVIAGSRMGDDGPPVKPDASVRDDGSLTVDPRPLTLDDVERERHGSPSKAVMRLWFMAQWGSSPSILSAYLPAVLDRLGAEDVAGAYAMSRATMVASRPRIADVIRTRAGTQVNVEALRRNAEPERHSFTLARAADGQWRIVFDTLLENGISAFVRFRLSPDPDSGDAPARARRAGLAAARRYRSFYFEGLRPRVNQP